MPQWLVFALSAALLTSLNPIILKRVLRAVSPVATTWTVSLVSLPIVAALAVSLTPSFPQLLPLFFPSLLVAGLLNTAAHVSFAYALRLGDASIVAPMLSFSPLLTLLISMSFLGEIPSARGSFGIALVLVGAFWLTRHPRQPWHAPITSVFRTPSLSLVLLAGLLWAITPLAEKIAINNTSPPNPQLVASGSTFLLVLLLTPFIFASGRTALQSLTAHRRDILLAGLIGGTAPILGFSAMATGLLAYVTAAFKLSTAFTVLWARLLLKESDWLRRLPPALLMAAGTILIAL